MTTNERIAGYRRLYGRALRRAAFNRGLARFARPIGDVPFLIVPGNAVRVGPDGFARIADRADRRAARLERLAARIADRANRETA